MLYHTCMSLNISTIIFITVSVIFFYIAPRFARKTVLLIESLFFCLYLDRTAFVILVIITLLTYAAGIAVEKTKDTGSKRYILTASISFFILNLLFWKGYPMIKTAWTDLILPVGLSFYTFQAISYLTDIYMGKQKAERNIVSFGIYMTWFPKLISGPIERAGSFISELEQIRETRLFDGSRIIKALSYILWGMFMKLMIADRAGIMVDIFFEDPGAFPALYLLAGSLLYTLQIYCDFAGYTNIMIGISGLFGIELTQNFKTPYLSENISDFWKTWHITLSSFLRDYIYIPLGGNRKGNKRKYINILAVFIISGIWHGRGTGFIIWGLIHGLGSLASGLLKDTRLSFITKGIPGRLVTFCTVSFAWIFFRAGSLKDSMAYVINMFSSRGTQEGIIRFSEDPGCTTVQISILLIAVLVLFAADLISYRKRTIMPELIINMGEIKRDTVYLILAVSVLIFGVYGDRSIGTFIYMNF